MEDCHRLSPYVPSRPHRDDRDPIDHADRANVSNPNIPRDPAAPSILSIGYTDIDAVMAFCTETFLMLQPPGAPLTAR